MAKFKQPNRKKRKYIKRSSPISELSLSRSAWIRLMPYSVIAVGLFSTLLMGQNTFQPTESFQPSIPQLTIPRPTAPQVSINPFLDVVTMLSYLTLSVATAFASIFNLIAQGLTNLITAILQSISVVATFALNGIEELLSFLSRIALATWNQVSLVTLTIAEGIKTLILSTLSAIYNLLTFTLSVVEGLITQIWTGLNALWYFLTTPFRVAAALYVQYIKPILDFVALSTTKSTSFVIDSMMWAGQMK